MAVPVELAEDNQELAQDLPAKGGHVAQCVCLNVKQLHGKQDGFDADLERGLQLMVVHIEDVQNHCLQGICR